MLRVFVVEEEACLFFVLFWVFCFETGSCYAVLAILELHHVDQISKSLRSACLWLQSTGVKGVCHYTQHAHDYFK